MVSKYLNTADKTSWNRIWESVYKHRGFGEYPSEELIRFTARNFYQHAKRSNLRFLDLGCGTGANSWYIAKEGFSTYGIDGSKTAILRTKKRLAKDGLRGKFFVRDYIQLNFPSNYFDAVVDISSLEHNHKKCIPSILIEISRVLKPGGKLFSMMVARGTIYEPFKNMGYVHFYNIREVRELFKLFKILSIEKNLRTRNNRRDKIIHWCITCEK